MTNGIKTTTFTKRIYGLDILRAFAIIVVVISHASLMLPLNISNYFYEYMIDGVSIFFVLSGFLIGNILLKKISDTDFSFVELIDFWIRRWLRTLPAFFIVIGILLFFYWYTNALPTYKRILECLTFSQAFLFGKTTVYFESWSLAVEEWFYLLLPLVLYFCFSIFKSNRKKTFLVIILTVIILDTVLRYYITSQIDYTYKPIWDDATRRPVFLRMDSIMFGVLGSWLFYYRHKLWTRKNLLFFIGIGIFIALTITGFTGKFNFSFFKISFESIATLFLLPKLQALQSGKGLVFKIITFVSIISYSLYLLNATPFYAIVYPYFKKYMPVNETSPYFYPAAMTFYFTCVTGTSYLLYRIIEKPFMKLRDRVSHNARLLHAAIFKPSTSAVV